ncbi:MAG TPA: MerR family transcriptional regulator [Caulobacteraceae bacterium]|nr:MerR family transcriptional regulator [Caulobacteraceae bacterium]
MKMRELEKRSGVGRETIRYYIRLGLLPEPERPKPNVAAYSDEHVRRLAVIRRLQAERYLPLGFIKQVLDRPSGGEITPVPGLEGMLATSLGVAAADGATPLAEAAGQAGLEPAEIETLVRDGVLEARAGALAPLDLAIAKAWGRVKASGFTEAAGFFAEDARLYVETIEPLARREIERFYGRLSGSGSAEDMARLGQAGIEHVNDLIALLRTRILLRLVAEMNARAAGRPGLTDPA